MKKYEILLWNSIVAKLTKEGRFCTDGCSILCENENDAFAIHGFFKSMGFEPITLNKNRVSYAVENPSDEVVDVDTMAALIMSFIYVHSDCEYRTDCIFWGWWHRIAGVKEEYVRVLEAFLQGLGLHASYDFHDFAWDFTWSEVNRLTDWHTVYVWSDLDWTIRDSLLKEIKKNREKEEK